MTYTLRPYQRAAVDALFSYFTNNDGSPICVLPTGSGKSHVIAAFIEQTLAQWPLERFLIISHTREIILQDADKLPLFGVGFYSAGLNKREVDKQVTVANIQSIFKRAHEFGDISIVIIDESHMVSQRPDSMYRKFMNSLKKICPQVRTIGFTATPYRLESGPLIKGDNRLFTDIAVNVGIKELIDLGFLSPLVTAPTKNRTDVSKVKKRGGDYIVGDLEKAMNKVDITEAALKEVDVFCVERKSWLVFCIGVDHARDVAQAIRMHGHSAEVVVGDTPKAVRAQRLADFKAGKIRALVSVGVLVIGFDAPNADALINLRPTLSPGLWVQMVGRISRLHPGKENGLLLDFTNNLRIHGPVDLIDIDGDGEVRTSPYRVCPECGKLIEPKVKACTCGYSFDRECHKCHGLFDRDLKVCPDCGAFVPGQPRKADHNTEAAGGQVLSDGYGLMTEEIDSIGTQRHSKKGKTDSMKVTYWSPLFPYPSWNEWLCFDHGGYASKKAAQRWVRLGGKVPTPASVDEALERSDELEAPAEIRVQKEGKFWRVL